MQENLNVQVDVVIVGSGLIGATMALQLAKLDLTIAVIESNALPQIAPLDSNQPFSHRVSALNNISQRLYQSLGVWEIITDYRYSPFTDMHVWDAEGTGSIHFSASEVYEKYLGYIVENTSLVAAIIEQLKRCNNIQLITEKKVAQLSDVALVDRKNYRRLVLDDETTVSAKLIIAADGANSRLRQLAQLPIREWSMGQQAIVTTVETEMSHQATAWQRFLTTGPLAFLPLLTTDNNKHYCSIVWSLDTKKADEIMQLSDDEFCQSLGISFENQLGEIKSATKRYVFPLHQRYAKQYVQPGFALIGDAAHTIHPLAGQGANLGILDSIVLSEELQRGISLGIDVSDDKILQRYQRRRKGQNLAMIGIMEGFKQLFAQQSLPVRWLRNTGLRVADQITPLKKLIIQQAVGLSQYHSSDFID